MTDDRGQRTDDRGLRLRIAECGLIENIAEGRGRRTDDR
ncbi:hypothetical protein D1AOALGA4SA_8068 [Olavius algarvensis Delta 1 endosymbiont]|nr:hypothetical protein D1AOALGA4SA_8068 [Olavius algarvensis Delta 1 endosymbiont]